MRVQLLAGWCRAVIIVIAHVSFSRSLSLLFFLSGTPWPHWIARRAVNPHTMVGYTHLCWRRWRMYDLLEAKVRSTLHERYILLRYIHGKARARQEINERQTRTKEKLSNEEVVSPYIRYRAQWKTLWRGIISMSVRIVCQNRNMVVHVKWERPRASGEDWNLINPTGTLLVPLILQELVEGLFAIYFHLFRLQSVSFCYTGFALLILRSTCMFEIE